MDFFNYIYHHAAPNLHLAWGGVRDPIFPTVRELIDEKALVVETSFDLYYTPGVFRVPAQGRKKANCAGASVVWAEVDDYGGAEANLRAALVPPSFVVASGRGHHLYWLLNGFYTPKIVEAANKAMSQHLGITGEGCWDCTRYLRVPGSYNYKCRQPEKYPEYRDLGPLEVKIEIAEPARVYNPEDLARLQPYDPAILIPPVANGGGEDESLRDWNLGVLLALDWGLPRPLVETILLAFSSKAQARKDYLKLTLDKIYTKSNGSHRGNAKLANVHFEPLAWLVDADGNDLGLSIRLTWPPNHKRLVAASATNFQSRRDVMKWLAHHSGTRMFFGTDKQALNLWGSLVENCPDATRLQIEHAGRYELSDGPVFVYAEDKAVDAAGQIHRVHWEPPIKIKARDRGHMRLCLDGAKQAQISEMLGLTLHTQVPSVIYPAVGWMAIMPLKTIVEAALLRMPALMLYGAKGSGKTSLIQYVLLPLLGIGMSSVNSETTLYALLSGMSQGHLPVWFGEFRSTNSNAEQFQQVLRSAYETGVFQRGNPNKTVDSYSLVGAPLIDGEDRFSDGANLERTVSLFLDGATIRDGGPCCDAFHRLTQTWDATDRAAMAGHYILWTLQQPAQEVQQRLKEAVGVFSQRLQTQSRVVNNVAVLWVGWQLLCSYVAEYDLDVTMRATEDDFIKAVNNTYRAGLGTVAHIDKLATMVSHFFDRPGLNAEWDATTDTLWFNLTRAIHLFQFRVSDTMLRMQLQERTASYIRGPEPRRGNAEYWGIHIATAQAYGLDVYRPPKIKVDRDGTGQLIL